MAYTINVASIRLLAIEVSHPLPFQLIGAFYFDFFAVRRKHTVNLIEIPRCLFYGDGNYSHGISDFYVCRECVCSIPAPLVVLVMPYFHAVSYNRRYRRQRRDFGGLFYIRPCLLQSRADLNVAKAFACYDSAVLR